jgi:hypothetical protein
VVVQQLEGAAMPDQLDVPREIVQRDGRWCVADRDAPASSRA